MKRCSECQADYPAPSIQDGVAYYVCDSCGNSIETDGLELLGPEERAAHFEKLTGLRLPESFVKLGELGDNCVATLPDVTPPAATRHFPDGHYEIGDFLSVAANDRLTIFDSPALAQEWGLPESVLPIEGDGHIWLAFDFRGSNKEPSVVLWFSDSGETVPIAESFELLIRNLIPRG